MTRRDNLTLYMKGDRDVEVKKQSVTLGDILSMECTDKNILATVKSMTILKIRSQKHQRYVISVLRIIQFIHEKYPDLTIENLGETDIIITYETQKTSVAAWHIVKIIFVAVVTFCGAAFSIMAFNNDVDVTRLFGQIYEQITGQESSGYTILEISYSLGIIAGILIFFNHFGRKRFTVDPTPMEIQMRLYENDIQTTLVENSARKGEELDVDGSGNNSGPADPAGNHRS